MMGGYTDLGHVCGALRVYRFLRSLQPRRYGSLNMEDPGAEVAPAWGEGSAGRCRLLREGGTWQRNESTSRGCPGLRERVCWLTRWRERDLGEVVQAWREGHSWS